MLALISNWLVAFTLVAQIEELKITSGCNYSDRPEERQYFAYYPSDQAVSIVEDILKSAGINPMSYDLTVKVSNVSNAIATKIDGKKYILYSDEFLQDVAYTTENKWAIYSILAHEIAHHLLGHDFDEVDPEKRKLMELQADEYSGTILRSLCATREDALVAIESLDLSLTSNYYPPVSARIERISSSWDNQDRELVRRGDPCGVEFIPELGFGYKKKNLVEKVTAKIKGGELIFFYDVTSIPGVFNYEPRIVTDKNSLITPRTINWGENPNKAEDNKIATWYFERDGYTKDDILNREKIGLAVFKNKVPKPVPVEGYSYGVGGILVGSGLLIMSNSQREDALALYEAPYSQVRNPLDDIYKGDNPSRPEIYNEANKEYRKSQGFRNAGIFFIAGGTAALIHKLFKDKKGKLGILHFGEGTIGIKKSIFDNYYDRNN